MADTSSAKKVERPLSPHLQVYKPQMTSVMSILHRMTGIANTIGLLMVSWGLIALATGPEAFEIFTGFTGSLLGQILLFGWTLSLYYHLCNGVRHLFWDFGKLFELRNAYAAGYLVWAVGFLLTALTWAAAYLV